MYKDTEMLERQDIDALLMGALYGELSPDESTRLEEHLSAHPQDRHVLDGLSRARQALKDSLVLSALAEPPAAVSAQLMQEAARRAPAPREQRAGFFAKLIALMRHPAFAAAAVIVLVAAVGGTLYMKNGDRAALEQAPSAATPSDPAEPALMRSEAPGPSAPVVAQPPIDEAETAADTDGYTADLDGKLAVGEAQDKNAAVKPPPDKGGKGKPDRTRDYVEVRTPERSPKDPVADADKVTKKSATPPGERGAGGKAQTTATVIVPADTPDSTAGLSMGGDLAKSGGSTTAAGAAGAPQSPQAGRTAAQPAPPPEPSAGDSEDVSGSSKNETEKTDPYAAAKSQHRRVVSLVKANKCNDASKLAMQIADNYADYYRQFVATDRKLKACKPYIENARKKNLEKAKRQRVDQQSDEAPAPDSMKITD
jgi:hypothetical protein